MYGMRGPLLQLISSEKGRVEHQPHLHYAALNMVTGYHPLYRQHYHAVVHTSGVEALHAGTARCVA